MHSASSSDDRFLSTLLLLCVFTGAFWQSKGGPYGHALSAIAVIPLFLISPLIEKPSIRLWPLLVAVLLFIYTLLTSKYLPRSLTTASSIFGCVLFYLSLSGPINTDGSRVNNSLYELALRCLLVLACIHSLYSVIQYILMPARVTGLLSDYSQASLIILLCFALSYTRIRDKSYGVAITFLLFLGFFTPFSRSVNFLLILFLGMLFCIELKNKATARVAKHIAVIIVAAIIVYLFPLLVEGDIVNRGGLSQFSTLNSRTIYWEVAWQAILENPLFGHGLMSYQFTGIQTHLPFHEIYHIHNDYLQIWHDLGGLWSLLFVICCAWLLLRNAPVKIKLGRPLVSIRPITDEKLICGSLLWLLALYMMINFMVLHTVFMLTIALILFELHSNETN